MEALASLKPIVAAVACGGAVYLMRLRAQAGAGKAARAADTSEGAAQHSHPTSSSATPLVSADAGWETDDVHAPKIKSAVSSDGLGSKEHMWELGMTQRFVLTGGPCAGKTTALARLSQFLRSRGFNVFIVPEAATMLWSGGANLDMIQTPANTIAFQTALMKIQIALEDQFTSVARLEARRTGRTSIVICDRGLLDGRAYMDPEDWRQMLHVNGLDNEVTLRDSRYHCVLHMVTAADGAADFYTLDTNTTRTETPEQAIAKDRALLAAWAGHPRLRVFRNNTDFEGKMQAVVGEVSQLLGMPSSSRRFRRFLLVPGSWDATAPEVTSHVRVETFQVEKVYVQAPSEEGAAGVGKVAGSSVKYPYAFVRKRQQGKSAAYGHTLVRMGADGKAIETKRIMSARGYDNAVRLYADAEHEIVKQRRTVFMWRNQFCEVNEYLSPSSAAGMCLLSVQATDDEASDAGSEHSQPPGDTRTDGDAMGTPVVKKGAAGMSRTGQWLDLPSFLRIQQEVTGEKAYSAYTLSHK